MSPRSMSGSTAAKKIVRPQTVAVSGRSGERKPGGGPNPNPRRVQSARPERFSDAGFETDDSEKMGGAAGATTNEKRGDIVSWLNSLTVEDSSTITQRHVDAVRRELTEEISGLKQERDQWKAKVTFLEEHVSELGARFEGNERILAVLQRKLQSLSAREVEQQIKLRTFSTLEPVLHTLSEKFHFSSPAEIIERLESLERTHLESLTELHETTDTKQMLEKERNQLRQQKEAQLATQWGEMQKQLSSKDTRIEELTLECEQLQTSEQRHAEVKDRYHEVSAALVDWYSQWSEESSLSANFDESQLPRMTDPSGIISFLQQVLTLHHPSKSSKQLQQMLGVANTLWVRHFKDDLDLKTRPREVFMQLSKKHESLQLELKRTQGREDRANDELKNLQVKYDLAQREIRRLNRMQKGHPEDS